MRRLWLIFSVVSLCAQRAPLFKDEILPVLEKSCTKCHGAQQKMGGLDLSTFTGVMKGGASGPAIAPGKPERSLLWVMIASDKMPVGGALTAAQKQLIRTYIEQGRFPAGESDAERAAKEAEMAGVRKEVAKMMALKTRRPSSVRSAPFGTLLTERGPRKH